MKATNQGFIDLHTPGGFMLIGAAFLLVSALILLGSVYAKKVAADEKKQRQELKEGLSRQVDKSTGPKS